ncbi:nuclear transport factor 2 family protein [Acinetobacter haemolyticus]|uniref:nuclear transport factor 2 family protein n=1 Tax=Acinetobacter haemolyticus TaxID=29430 RepID=UPI0002E20455|nr:nuclear transport factor 2 family protein [Acinetobacter haemolyticus]NAR51963.1 nuclear transport factor 2 family protein [Acinetobacter haemolyticus]NAR55195.1 nuclear transport factor 2 family protein [Acinetobacter haemolyticus]NAR62068.1 nuclear transport factor 2 family protein [Acinetobacter haemolyticus]NAR68049.1 nuclear transport factor 2 family protein [Acinetobacter haemolyticus]NAR70671.1 nuclear transport factor 2 family protein [Acinetobacter haemolyticus]
MKKHAIFDIQQQIEKYFDALYFCDLALLKQVFHADAIYMNVTEQPILRLDMAEYFSIVESRTSPALKNQIRQDKVKSIHLIHDQLAIVHVECVIEPKYFYDALTFTLDHDQWKIISKVFSYQLLD